MRNIWNIRTKQLVAMLFSALVPLFISSIISFGIAKNIILKSRISDLEVINSTKAKKIDDIFDETVKKIKTLQTNNTVLVNLNIVKKTIQAKGSPEYQKAKNALNQILRLLQRTSQFDDIYLLDENGIVVYASDIAQPWRYLGHPLSQDLKFEQVKATRSITYSNLFLNKFKAQSPYLWCWR
jgi:C4-dicarboxylate-specific signal transduction histidine kinase